MKKKLQKVLQIGIIILVIGMFLKNSSSSVLAENNETVNSTNYSYDKGMEITEKIKNVKDSYNAFVDAGDFENAKDYVNAIQQILENAPGIYKETTMSEYTCYLLINENLEVDRIFEPDETVYYLYDLLGKMNDHYVIFSELGYGRTRDDENGEEMIKKIIFDDDYSGFTLKDAEDGEEDYFYKISEKEFEQAKQYEIEKKKKEELAEELDTLPVMSTDEALSIFTENTFQVDYLTGVTEDYTFHADNTYTILSEDGSSKTREWKNEDGTLYSTAPNGEFIEIFQFYKYYNGEYLLCMYSTTVNSRVIWKVKLKQEVEGIEKELVKEEYFYECEEILTPDSVDEHFTYQRTKQNENIIMHYYSISADDAETASDILQIYYDYLSLNTDLRDKGYTFNKDSDTGTFYVYKNGGMLIAMQGGTDEEMGYFVICSMEAK